MAYNYMNGLYDSVGRNSPTGYDMYGKPFVGVGQNAGSLAGGVLAMTGNPILGGGMMLGSQLLNPIINAIQGPARRRAGKEMIDQGISRAKERLSNTPYASFEALDKNFQTQQNTQNELLNRQIMQMQNRQNAYSTRAIENSLNNGMARGSAMAQELMKQRQNNAQLNNTLLQNSLRNQQARSQWEMSKFNLYPEIKRRRDEIGYEAMQGAVNPAQYMAIKDRIGGGY